MKAPCYKCTDRHTTCHVSCEKYIKFKKEHDEEKKAMRKKQQEELRMAEYIYDRSLRLNKHRYKKY